MDTFISKLIYLVGFITTNVLIRGPRVKAYKRQKFQATPTTRQDRILFAVTLIGACLIPILYLTTPVFRFADYTLPLAVSLTGIALMILGNWLFWRAHVDLGVNWSPTIQMREGHELITRGIYRHVRHPMYAAIWLIVLSQAMILPNYVAGWSGVLGFGLLYFGRVGKEEQMMLGLFGKAYEEYMRKTGRLLPKF